VIPPLFFAFFSPGMRDGASALLPFASAPEPRAAASPRKTRVRRCRQRRSRCSAATKPTYFLHLWTQGTEDQRLLRISDAYFRRRIPTRHDAFSWRPRKSFGGCAHWPTAKPHRKGKTHSILHLGDEWTESTSFPHEFTTYVQRAIPARHDAFSWRLRKSLGG
jgi:hypothetical protein